ncbi:MAG: hypothetical protein H8E36_05935 [Rhodospirillaceae bacterium]|nr:hypothetical protein [Rhodospirillaceae bacterium]MBL6941481.1 hypothetical protein [Rhodospirillales bacterium]
MHLDFVTLMVGARMASFFKLLTLSLLTAVSCFTFTPNAYSLDIHELFETRCGNCHQHSGELALKKLVIENGVLRGENSGNVIDIFLPMHFGHPNPEETTALYDLFLWQVRAAGCLKAVAPFVMLGPGN